MGLYLTCLFNTYPYTTTTKTQVNAKHFARSKGLDSGTNLCQNLISVTSEQLTKIFTFYWEILSKAGQSVHQCDIAKYTQKNERNRRKTITKHSPKIARTLFGVCTRTILSARKPLPPVVHLMKTPRCGATRTDQLELREKHVKRSDYFHVNKNKG